MAERGVYRPPTKRRRSYKHCDHCGKDLSVKIYKEHKRLYYDPNSKSWTKDVQQRYISSTEFSSIDSDIDMVVNTSSEKSEASGESDFVWEEQLSSDNHQSSSDENTTNCGIENWIESDFEIDKDVMVEEAHIPHPEIELDHLTQDSAKFSIRIRWIIALLSIFQTQFYLTNRALSWLLNFLFVLFRFLGRYSPKLTELAMKFPRSVHQSNKLISNLTEVNSFERRAVCVLCESLYKFDDCLRKVGTRTDIVSCKNKLFNKTCNQLLMREVVSSNGSKKFYPHKVYCFINSISYLQMLFMRTGFFEQCESTRNQFSTSGLSDVYDGTLWNDFLRVGDIPFLSECYNYGLMLNIDWLQPYKHMVYSVGVIYLVILNLPRSIRYKHENVILFGVIPGPHEPSLTINTYLSPLVSEIEELWQGIQFKLRSDKTERVRFALLGVACDLPAARKSCGFLSFSANLGCLRCFQQLSRGFGKRNYYANFNRESWEMRTNARHRSDVKKVLQCTFKTEKEKTSLVLAVVLRFFLICHIFVQLKCY